MITGLYRHVQVAVDSSPHWGRPGSHAHKRATPLAAEGRGFKMENNRGYGCFMKGYLG